MARKRMIDPGIWGSEDFSKLSTLAKLVFIGLFSNADDEGRGRAKAAYIKSTLFPYDDDKEMPATNIDKALSEIASNMSVTFYLHGENEYYSLDKWEDWQVINRPTPSKIPPFTEDSLRTHGGLTEDSLPIEKNRIEQEKKGIEKNITTSPRAKEPSPKERHEETFKEFWSAYPKKRSKNDALKAWLKLKPDTALFEKIMSAIAEFKGSHDWQREDGQFIPYPASWLRAGGWEDEPMEPRGDPPRKKTQNDINNERIAEYLGRSRGKKDETLNENWIIGEP